MSVDDFANRAGMSCHRICTSKPRDSSGYLSAACAACADVAARLRRCNSILLMVQHVGVPQSVPERTRRFTAPIRQLWRFRVQHFEAAGAYPGTTARNRPSNTLRPAARRSTADAFHRLVLMAGYRARRVMCQSMRRPQRASCGGINIAHLRRPATAFAHGAACQTDRTAFKQTQ
ncbi:MAG: hypothetical protein EPN70_04385 [Paraburkholderia sp.]|uniref:hypothetical protein n=1 Tax=Paraburkholderia sp. TaxID=1926495 RepID=UPI001227EDF9|nr:hypothetical protein [Paraburkholderia sp.]TAM06862.1 MAG: hypothetical protein EPN70_04385 [Paraburkholderia sp.]TAM28868.1 MAG: hypothetical protein EPN59_14290 [Paraburkholderia sp.]